MLKAEYTIPPCYGDFDRDVPECVGGHDPAYPENGHIRPVCDFVQTCSQRTQATKASAIIPVSNLIKPQTQFNQPYTTTPYQAKPYASVNPPALPNGYHAGMPQVVSVNYMMPQYLTIRESITGGGLLRRLGVEVVRSMGKSVGHTVAHFFDVEQFMRKDSNEPK